MNWTKIVADGPMPDLGQSILYCTVNRKVMVCRNDERTPFDEWFIRKYSATHWAPVELPAE